MVVPLGVFFWCNNDQHFLCKLILSNSYSPFHYNLDIDLMLVLIASILSSSMCTDGNTKKIHRGLTKTKLLTVPSFFKTVFSVSDVTNPVFSPRI